MGLSQVVSKLFRVVSARGELEAKWCYGLDYVNKYKGLGALLERKL